LWRPGAAADSALAVAGGRPGGLRLSEVTRLRWRADPLASALHAAEAVLRGRALADPALAGALAGPAAALKAALEEDGLRAEKFLPHLNGLAAGGGGSAEVAEVALAKAAGRGAAARRAFWYRGLLADLRAAFARAVPDLSAALAEAVGALRGRWAREGVAVLGGLAAGSEPELLSEEAAVVAVYPALGGGGAACPAYNVARVEAVRGDPVPDLPEVLRLAWLLALLNLDRPRYAEAVAPGRLPAVAGLAAVPLTLRAAEGPGLVRCDPPTVCRAAWAWLAPEDLGEGWDEALGRWWDVYAAMRPPWPTALAALDRMLREGGAGV
jgi:hypothetical protein